MTLHFSLEEEIKFRKEMIEVHFESKFGFLNSHNGLRKGCLHLLIGGTSGGKSTLMRSMVRDILFSGGNNPTLGLWLTEESIDEYRQQLSLGLPSHQKLLNTEAYYENGQRDVSELLFFEWLEFNKPDIFILDNITTCRFYMDKSPEVQARFVLKIKEIVKRLNIATIIVAHTDGATGDKSGMIEINNVRGSKQVANLSEFAYILQGFKIDETKISTIRIVKHRSQELVHDLFMLIYDNRFRCYTRDTALPFKEFKESYAKRNRL